MNNLNQIKLIVVLFRRKWRNEHYGVLCGELSQIENRNKFWCHIYDRLYQKEYVIYWTAIPLNQHTLLKDSSFASEVNKFLWEKVKQIEESILKDFEKQKEENPERKSV